MIGGPEDYAYEQARQERIDSDPDLKQTLRIEMMATQHPDPIYGRCLERIEQLERERDAALRHEAEMGHSVVLTGQVAFQAQEAAKDLAKQLDAANELIRAYREVWR